MSLQNHNGIVVDDKSISEFKIIFFEIQITSKDPCHSQRKNVLHGLLHYFNDLNHFYYLFLWIPEMTSSVFLLRKDSSPVSTYGNFWCKFCVNSDENIFFFYFSKLRGFFFFFCSCCSWIYVFFSIKKNHKTIQCIPLLFDATYTSINIIIVFWISYLEGVTLFFLFYLKNNLWLHMSHLL